MDNEKVLRIHSRCLAEQLHVGRKVGCRQLNRKRQAGLAHQGKATKKSAFQDRSYVDSCLDSFTSYAVNFDSQVDRESPADHEHKQLGTMGIRVCYT